MRVLMTTDTIGGVWTFTRELSTELLSNGCAVALTSFGRAPSATQRKWVADQRSRWGANFYFAASNTPLEWMEDNASAFAEGALFLTNIANNFGAELLVSSQYCFGALDVEIPKAIVAHSDVLSWADTCRGGYLAASAWLDDYLRLVSDGLRDADAVVAPTRWMLEALASHFALPPDAQVIYNGRTLNSGAAAQRKLQAVSAGRLWDEGKNLQMLANVRTPFPILIAGETEHESARLRLGSSTVTLLGGLGEDELLTLFRSSSIYVCMSRYEPFGYAPIEAALCGCAVLANDIPSLREVWGEAALYFTDGDTLSALLEDLAGNQQLLQSARNRARARASEFTARQMGAGYLRLCERLLHKASARQYA